MCGGLNYTDFHYLTENPEKIKWFCINGGANFLAREMKKKMTATPQYENPVTSIKLEDKKDTHVV